MIRMSALALAIFAAAPCVAAPIDAPAVVGGARSKEGTASFAGQRKPKANGRRTALNNGWRAQPLIEIAAANRSAVRGPDPAFFIGASQVYPWSEGALFRLYGAPEEVSDIVLEAGENLVSVAAGDTVRWVIGDTASGSGATRRTHILVKPVAAGLRTNLVIATDRRIYHVEAISTAATAMAAMSWTYPEESLVAIGSSVPSAPEPVVAPAVAVETLNFGYRIEGDDTHWRPVRAFDDGHQTFIEFPATIADGEAPPLFITGEKGKAELVNYRVKGRYYVVDRLFVSAQLRLGGKHQKVVTIARDDGSRRARRNG